MKKIPGKTYVIAIALLIIVFFVITQIQKYPDSSAPDKPAAGKPVSVAEIKQSPPDIDDQKNKPPDIKIPDIKIIDKPVAWSEKRERLMREYAQIHYGMNMNRIKPKAVVVHWTVSNDWESVYKYFYAEEMPDDYGKLNVCFHFLVARDGTIFRLTPEDALNRHAIGLNWCAIGIENVGGVNGREDLTPAQLEADLQLIRYLKTKFPGIEYVLGHYQQNQARKTELWIEKIPDYYADKTDPGPKFMKGLRNGLQDTNLKFFPE